MKLLLPEIDIKEGSGFDSEIDIFKRKDFGERLANLIDNTNDNPVFALDAKWGEGKSTFIKMWMDYVQNQRDKKIKVVYFDAFENDYQKDPFLTLASEIYNLISDKDEKTKKEFKEKATGAVKSLMRGALRISVKTITAGIVDGSDVESEISNLISGQVDELISDKFNNVQIDKTALTNFREFLEEFSKSIDSETPIVFIIDELDRCKPDFALDLLEQVKHLFSVKGITFILVTNRIQLEEMIKLKYGQGVDATNYLHKFINIWLTLPKENSQFQNDGVNFLNFALKRMFNEEEQVLNSDSIEIFKEIIKFYQPSLREIERMLSYYAIIHNMSKDKYILHYQLMISFVCFIASCHTNIIRNIEKFSPNKIIELIDLNNLKESDEFYTLKLMKNFILYDLSDEETKKIMVGNKDIVLSDYGRTPNNVIKTVIGWVSEIKQQH